MIDSVSETIGITFILYTYDYYSYIYQYKNMATLILYFIPILLRSFVLIDLTYPLIFKTPLSQCHEYFPETVE